MVAGHVAALMLAHDRALALYDDPARPCARSTGCWRSWSASRASPCGYCRRRNHDLPDRPRGHWLTTIAYFVLVVAFLVWLGITQIRERRRGRHEQ